MTDIFDAENITSFGSGFASTAPSTKPADIPAAPASTTKLTTQSSNAASIAAPPDPQQIASRMGGGSQAASAVTVEAPPQSPANSPDIFDQEGMSPQSAPAPNSFNKGVIIPPINASELEDPNHQQVAQYVQDQAAQTSDLAAKRFTPQQIADFTSNPQTLTDAIRNQQDWPDVPALLQKYNSGEQLSDAQKGRLNEYIDTKLQSGVRGTQWGGNTAVSDPQLSSAAINYVNSGDSGQQPQGNEVTPGQAPMAQKIMPAPYTPAVGEKPINAYAAVTDKGQQIVQNGDQQPATAALKAAAYATPLNGVHSDDFSTATSVKDLPPQIVAALYEGYKAQNPNASLSDMQTKFGYDKAVDAIGEDKSAQILSSVANGTASNAFDHYVQEGGRDILQAGTFINPYTLATRIYDIPLGAVEHLTQFGLQKLPPDSPFYSAPGAPPTQATFGQLYDWIGEQLFPGGAPESKTAQYVDTAATFAGGGAALSAPSMGMKILNGVIGAGVGAGGQFSSEKAMAWAQKEFPNNPTVQAVISETAGLMAMLGIGAGGHLASKALPGAEAPEAASGEAPAYPQQAKTFDDHLDVVSPDKNQMMVDNGMVSVEGTKSQPHQAAEQVMQQKGLDPATAQETVANMTANEKDKFVADNTPRPAVVPEPYADQQTKFFDSMNGQGTHADIARNATPATQELVHNDETANAGSPTAQVISGQNAGESSANPSLVPPDQSTFRQKWKEFKDGFLTPIYSEALNDIQAIENLTKIAKERGADVPIGKSTQVKAPWTKTTIAWINENQWVKTTTFDDAGNKQTTGKALGKIYDDMDTALSPIEKNWKTRNADMNDYQQAMTMLEDKRKGLSAVSEAQESKSRADIDRLQDKYGEHYRWFQTLSQEVRGWDNRILHNLVTSGLKTQEWYDQTTGARDFYSPLSRVITDEGYDKDIQAMGNAIGKDVTPSKIGSLKQRKGSDLEVKDVLTSRLRNSAIVLQKSAVNKLRSDIAEFKEFYPEKIKVTPPSIIRDAALHSYDPKLRSKLEQVVEKLGGSVKRVDKIEGSPKGTRGQYNEMSDEVSLRSGTTESTLTHELGHQLDSKLDLKEKLLGDPTMKAELEKLAEDRLNADVKLETTPEGKTTFAEEFEKNPKKFQDYVKEPSEVIANFFDAYVNSRDQVRETAPKALAEFERMLDEKPELNMLKELEPSTARATETLQREMRDMRGPKDSIPVYIKGQRNYMELDPELKRAFDSLTPMQLGWLGKFFKGVLNVGKYMLQTGATHYPAFMIRHFIRAVHMSFLNTEGKFSPAAFAKHAFINMPKAMFAVFRKNELYHDWASSSGSLKTFMDLSDKAIGKQINDAFGKSDMAKYLDPRNWYSMMREQADYAPRIATYLKAKESGMSDIEAGLASLEATGNYIRHGSLARKINQASPFFNDMAQSGDRFIRSIMRNPAAFTVKALATITVPQILITGYYLWGADQKTRDEYLHLGDFRRSMAFNFKVGNTWIPIPRPFAPGFIFGAIPEKIMVYLAGGDHAAKLKGFWLNLLGESASSLAPVSDWTRALPPMLKAAFESQANYSLFTKRPIFTGDVNKTAPEDQFNQYTSQTAKLMGHMLNYSPAKIDNTVYDMAGNMGRYAMELSDAGINAVKKMEGQPVNQRPSRPQDNPFYGSLTEETPRGTNTEAYQEFLEHVRDSEQATNHFNQLQGKEASAYRQENRGTLTAADAVNDANSQVNGLLKQARVINQNTKLSGDVKTEQINKLQDQVTKIIDAANIRYRKISDGGKK